ncbi:MAG TPA: pseudouridine synthase [Polyangiaceae bacterium LLY-WYZ-15_(1-7)]|nr:hypothetical protein [Myxococcales bacterium]HJL01032.1 pseudouridine synthase [Polyangiaceae bacterium LLY-WYZ-15_(1-7)]HJL12126.1 pseudouridine synthase [Polyangiaceae bacterium LLY-WYZ-15_(1-7)]HJL21502.1 pseudouridine synthase [Polyangiaceae bacterium LLY-WYZ-15_(1-7)]HJL33045.1 pseudouridine synthase [Polyangiaceae bacterium LLY-WYZ-15_(1-7)]
MSRDDELVRAALGAVKRAGAGEGEPDTLGARRRVLFPDFEEAWILAEKGGLIAVDKPAGVPSQAADPSWPDDVVTRLGRFLEARGEDGYLGVHQRLDRDTSGVLVFARDKAKNPALADQFEGRRVDKRYLACVRGWKGGAKTLRHRLAKVKGRVQPVGKGDRRGKRAVTHVEVAARRGDRALLALRIETGRTHQIRAQLAAVGCPVAGDAIYEGPAAPRLMLHAAALGLEGGPRFEAPTPRAFDAWLAGQDAVSLEDAGALDDALARAMQGRWGLGRAAEAPAPTTAFRLLNGEGEGVPGLAVDVYGEHLVAHLYGAEALRAEDGILDALAGLGFAGVYVKRRPRQANEIVDPTRCEIAPAGPVRGRAAPEEFEVRENGLRFPVRLGDGLSTGVFLDQRDARARVRAEAGGRRVLNLFAYTGPFSVAAAAGGAREVATVDVSAPALQRAREAFAANGLEGQRVVREDCFAYLKKLGRRGERFDLVIADPPTYATTKKTRWKSGKQWVGLAASCFAVAAPGAIVLLSSNDGRMSMGRFRRFVHEGAREAGVKLRQVKELPEPSDFPGSAPKRLWIRL